MSEVAIICDSTCDLGPQYFEDHGVIMVPLKVLIEDQTFLDWIDLDPEGFYSRQKSAAKLPTTSQPSPAEFEEAYRRAAESGATSIVAITLTSALSGTFQSASIAAETSQVPVHVVDTKLVSHGTGLVVDEAVRARDAGGDFDTVTKAAEDAVANTKLFFILDTLEFLVKGGRAGKAQGLAASVLNIKPILTFDDSGVIEPFMKAKGQAKAIKALAEHVAAESQRGELRVALLHAISPDLVSLLRSALDAAGAKYEIVTVGEIGSVIGNYAGPGALGIAYIPKASA